MSKPYFSQVAASLPYADDDSILGVLNAQDSIEDALWMHRNILPERLRTYFVPVGYQYKAFNYSMLDGYMLLDGDGVVF